MGNISSCVIVFVSLTIAGCAGNSVVVRTEPNPGDPVANYPKYCVGDKIVGFGYSSKNTGGDRYTQIVEKVHEDGGQDRLETTEKEKSKERWYVNNQGHWVSGKNLETGEDLPVAVHPAKTLDFPLFVGKQWKDSYEGKSVDGGKYTYKNTYTVTDYKKLKVDAGEFDVFRIEQIHFNTSGASSGKTSESIRYYAPAAKFTVKTIPSWRMGYEAETVDVKNCD